MPGSELSMFDKVEKQGARLDKHDERFDKNDEKFEKHEEILESHALILSVQAEKLRQLDENYIRLENVMMKESSSTRDTITATNLSLHTLIENLLGYKSGESQLSNNAKMAKEEAAVKLKLAKQESYTKIVGILIGSGGVLFYIIDKL